MELREKFYLHTPLGLAQCYAITLKNAVEVAVIFHTWQLETKEPWSWANPDVRIASSATARRDDEHTPIYLSPKRLKDMGPHILRHKLSPFYDRVPN